MLKDGGVGNSGNTGNVINGFGGVKLIVDGNVGVIAVFSDIVIVDLLILLGFIPALTSKLINGSVAKVVLVNPYLFAPPEA
jgi:hypothetical protein